MANTNTLTTILGDFTRHGLNIIQLLESIDNIVTGSNDFVTVTIELTDGTKVNKKLPSIGKIQKDITALQNLLNDLYDFKNNEVFVISEGVKHPVFIPDYPYSLLPPSNLTQTEFEYKNDNFFTRMYMDNIEHSVKYIKYIINADTETFNGIEVTNQTELLSFLNNNSISYKTEEDIIKNQPKTIQYTGSFNVLSNVKNVYRLDTVFYTNNNDDSFQLDVGDSVYFDNTELRIDNVNYDTNEITATTIKGYGTVSVGTELKLISPFLGGNYIDIPCQINEKFIVFLKNVNETFNVECLGYSGPYSVIVSSLTKNNQSIVTFNLNITNGGLIPRTLGIKPNSPVLNIDSFQVRKINDHLYQDSLVTSVQEKVSRKNEIISKISELDKAIDDKKTILNSSETITSQKRTSIQNDLANLVNKRKIESNEYTSIVNELTTINKDGVKFIKPKYRVRGFFDLPNEIYSEFTGIQNIVQFIISYRYKGINQNTTENQNFTRTNEDGNKKFGVFSDWTEVYSKQRIKSIDEITGEVIWEEQRTEDGQQVNINQIDIPIQKNESVEIRVRSISEAGFPGEPLLSNWSNIISIPFPEDLTEINELSDVIESSLNDDAQILVENTLSSKGVDTHISNSTTLNEKYLAHPSYEISSGIFENNENLTLEQVLKNYQSEITSIKNIVNNVIPELSVSIVDEDGTETAISKNSLNKIFVGYYVNDIETLPTDNQDGAIITKEYTLKLYNNSGVSLYLRSGIHGGTESELDTTYDLYSDRLYQNVPLSIVDDSSNFSKQNKGQFLYNRYKNYTFGTDFYVDPNDYSDTIDPHTWYVGQTDHFKQKEYESLYAPSFDSDETGAYLYTKINERNDLYVGAPDYGSVKELKSGKENAINIPVVFVYKLTNDSGQLPDGLTNVEFRKRIGFDVFLYQLNTFSFDMEFSVKYNRDTF